MARKLKHHDERRTELLDTAWALFGECGYEKATVSTIINRINVSKGTFYHYFSSKQEILDAAIEREVELSRLEIESAVNASPMAALEKLNRFFTITWEYKQSYIKSARWLAPILMADGDIVIRHKFDERTANMCATLLAQIISQGVEEGVFNTPNPQAVSQLIIRSWDSLKGAGATTLQEQHDVTLLAPRIKQVLDFYIDSVERLLGTEEGAITRPTESYVQTFAEIHSKLNTLSSE